MKSIVQDLPDDWLQKNSRAYQLGYWEINTVESYCYCVTTILA